MTNFQKLDLKEEYNSISDDVYRDFFNKVLSKSKRYARVGGAFTSRNFAACADGLQDFIQNDGNMQLILLPVFSQEDVEAIEKGIKNPDEVLSENWIRELDEIKEKFVEDHIKALAWMLTNNYLEIKLVIPYYRDGKIIPQNELNKTHIFKRKTGIFWSEDYESITFSGNVDFDDKLFGEYYYFRVYRSWDSSEKKYVDDDFEEFQKFWDGEKINGVDFELKSISLPKALKEKIIEIAPKSKSEINLEKPPKLRPYQELAISKWLSNNKTGIFEMATGTGKTFTALGCIKKLEKSLEKLLVIVVCPFDNLERQWSSELKKWNFENYVTSKDPKWSQNVRDIISSLDHQSNHKINVIITSYQTFHNQKFINIMNYCKTSILLIADEVHNAGSTENIKGLIPRYDYRLGLSATLERYFDDEGTSALQKYFGKTVYSLDLEQAIKDKFLVEYYYHLIYVDLTEEEYLKYKVFTKKIAQLWNSKQFTDRMMLDRVLQQRAQVIRDAENKIIAFENLISSNIDLNYSIIYCSENQMEKIKRKLNNVKPRPIIHKQITSDNPKDPRDRMKILKDLASGKYSAVVANRILDEGVDIPEAKNCIMIASTGNPKQFIQRRGRVLRKFSGRYPDGSKKEFAHIYDILVLPEITSDYTEDEIKTEKLIVKSQINRQELMAKIAINQEECMSEIRKIKEKFFL